MLVKALLVHGARAGDGTADAGLEDMRGYGAVECDLRDGCLAHRATVVAWGKVRSGEATNVVVPLPPSLATLRGTRTLATTLAWLAETNHGQRPYRASRLSFKYLGYPLGESKVFGRVGRDWLSTQRGTVQHDVRSGIRPVQLATPSLTIGIDSSATGGRTADDRFGIAVTLEVDSALGVDVYEEIRAGLRTTTQIRIDNRTTDDGW